MLSGNNININKDWLRIEKEEKQRSARDIAKELNCDKSTVLKHCKKYNINTKTYVNPDRVIIDRYWLEEQCKTRTMESIANEKGCHPQTIQHRCKKYGIKTKNLISRKNLSINRDEIIGTKIGLLEVVSFYRNSHKDVVYQCICHCGKNRKVLIKEERLLSGKPNGCGCLRGKRNNKSKRIGQINIDVFNRIKKGAEYRSIEFDITMEYLSKILIQQNNRCYYSGIQLYFPENNDPKRSDNCNASLDRIDSDIGYVEGNVVWCYKYVNMAKNDLSEKDFLILVEKIYHYKIKNNE